MIKAFQVHSECGESGAIVFAESHNKAKSMVAGERIVNGNEYHELRCQRMPEADKDAADTPSVLWWDLPSSAKIYYEMGWILHGALTCNRCGKGQFASVIESDVLEDGDGGYVCRGCLSLVTPNSGVGCCV